MLCHVVIECSVFVLYMCLQLSEGEVREEPDSQLTSDPAPPTKKRWWKQSGGKMPQKFGWIMGVLVSTLVQLQSDCMRIHVYSIRCSTQYVYTAWCKRWSTTEH